MSIFKARTDVYAKRWTSNKTGKSGYSPVCRNKFSKYKCDKFNVKCSECVHREHIEKTKVIVYDYLDNMKVLDKMYNRRLKGYKVAGYEIVEE